ncbi:hypothetical protein [Paucibacter sp. XJ19-41]|uniref:hypothetical protein n=1 Tax=Paucibacter sp. XJ19-41 TaxID=2927824 RepID=UPI00234B9B3C|nr:hypothetical protein [Paucibacter sp. XJ19-41]MDC6168714.1 hypothetical protein [Paucibacter sp. XJ19-41]
MSGLYQQVEAFIVLGDPQRAVDAAQDQLALDQHTKQLAPPQMHKNVPHARQLHFRLPCHVLSQPWSPVCEDRAAATNGGSE